MRNKWFQFKEQGGKLGVRLHKSGLRCLMSQNREHVLLIDDDVKLCEMLRGYLSRNGWSVSVAHTGEGGIRALRGQATDLIVLDMMLPDIDGFEVMRRVHRDSDVKVLLLTARGEEIDRIIGLEMGADDYLGKPFNPRELMARMRAVLRRSSPRETPKGGSLVVGDFAADTIKREIAFQDRPIALTDGEYILLLVLLQHAEEVVDRNELFDRTLGRKPRAFDRSLDMLMLRLRRKLDGLRGFTGEIKTVRSSGYIFLLQRSNSSEGDSE
ncbi:MAG: response regulator transcription factor [Edaphobacter sp.]|uniref:response regulator transcription factor n=1 Tax=Edaphobacter sp. TaxID=1934404 RepID=UPI00238F4EBB|nr:response regulator transcription factor [Edaphobacter sp.]MDE1176341.1 response regulator transcription factor [Edaphobacter sp.]